MSILSFIRNAFNTTNPVQQPVAAPIIKFIPPKVSAMKRTYDYQQATKVSGDISASQLDQLHSSRMRDGIFGYQAWVTLAQAFSAYQKAQGRYAREEDIQKVGHQLACFHGWNSRMTNPMQEEKVEEAVLRLTSVKVPMDNDETDAIRARIAGKDVAEIRKARLAKAELESKKREAFVQGFLAEVWSGSDIDEDPIMPVSKALEKAEQQLEWAALQDWVEPADLLIGEADVKMLQDMSRHEYSGYEGSRAIDEQLADEAMMQQAGYSGK